jgi:hypothetical protein
MQTRVFEIIKKRQKDKLLITSERGLNLLEESTRIVVYFGNDRVPCYDSLAELLYVDFHYKKEACIVEQHNLEGGSVSLKLQTKLPAIALDFNAKSARVEITAITAYDISKVIVENSSELKWSFTKITNLKLENDSCTYVAKGINHVLRIQGKQKREIQYVAKDNKISKAIGKKFVLVATGVLKDTREELLLKIECVLRDVDSSEYYVITITEFDNHFIKE